MYRLTGTGVSAGVAVGRAVLLLRDPLVIRFPIGADRVAFELARLEEARERSRRQLLEIKSRVARGSTADLGRLFDAQLLMIDDPMLVGRARDLIESQRANAEWALHRAFEDLSEIFDGFEDAYLRERKGDVTDVVGRLRMNLGRARGRGPELFRDVEGASVLVADDLTPSMAAQVDWRKILGFASDTGSLTHHTAILARSLRVPAVVGLGEGSKRIAPGATLVIDGTTGEVLVDPPPEIVEQARSRAARRLRPSHAHRESLAAAVTTVDGVSVSLQANIELPDDIGIAREAGATGIGLYRSEFLLAVNSAELLSEDVQYAAYRTLVEGMAPGVVTVRTFDVADDQLWRWGGDAARASFGEGAAVLSRGPLGLRAIRLGLERRDFLKTQLRALLRASRHGRLRILFPFVSSVEEVREAKAVLGEAEAELRAAGEAPDTRPPVGVMIEIPSAALTADLLAREADFFSIGTNDLTQFVLAVDRTDARVSRFYQPLHPAVLRTIRLTVRAARAGQVPVSLCGEMAADPVILPLLIGMGLADFSMNPAAIPAARDVVGRLRASDARRLAARVLRLATVAEIERQVARAAGGASGASTSQHAGTGGQREHDGHRDGGETLGPRAALGED